MYIVILILQMKNLTLISKYYIWRTLSQKIAQTKLDPRLLGSKAIVKTLGYFLRCDLQHGQRSEGVPRLVYFYRVQSGGALKLTPRGFRELTLRLCTTGFLA